MTSDRASLKASYLEAIKHLDLALSSSDEKILALSETQQVIDAAAALGVEALCDVLNHRYFLARSMACEALGDMDALSASSRLVRLLGDEDRSVRTRAREALEEIHNKRLSEEQCAELYKSVTGETLSVSRTCKIFVSYTHRDASLVNKVVNDLEVRSIKDIWLDTNIIDNEAASEAEIIDAVGPAVRSCTFFVTFISENSTKSNWVEREAGIVNLFRRYANPIIMVAVIIDPISLLTSINYEPAVMVDFSNPKLYDLSILELAQILRKPTQETVGSSAR
jgi:hypothetical protein